MSNLLKNKFLWIGLVIIIVVAIGGFYSYSQSQTPQFEETQLVNTKVKKTVSASGSVTSTNESDLSFPGVGKITTIYVSEGDSIEKDDLIAQLDSYSAYQTAQSAQDSVDIAKRDLEIYKENYETNWDAVGGEDEYRLNVKRLEELVSRAEATYQSQLGVLNNSNLYAPHDGTVVDVFYDEGESVIAGSAVVKVADLGNLIFEVGLDQEDFGILRKGQQVEIVLDSYEDEVFEGIVEELPLYADPVTDEFIVKIRINSQQAPVLLGMKGDAEIITDSSDGEVQALFFDSLFEDSDGTYVWVYNGEDLEKVYVETGLEGDLYTEIKTDLTGKQLVIPIEEE